MSRTKNPVQTDDQAADDDQLSLMLNIPAHSSLNAGHKYSHLVDFFDLLPIFSDRSSTYATGLQDVSIIRTPRIDGAEVTLRITSAQVSNGPDGKARFRFPGKRDQNVFAAIRYLAAQGMGTVTRRKHDLYPLRISVNFSSSQIRTCLKKVFRISMNLPEVRECIEVLSNAGLKISVEGYGELNYRLIDTVKDTSHEYFVAELHPIISHNILQNHQFQLQNPKYLRYGPLAQYILNRMHFKFLQAAEDRSFNLKLSTIIISGLGESYGPLTGQDIKRARYGFHKRVMRAINSLVDDHVFADCKVFDIKDSDGFIVDRKYEFFVTEPYVQDRIMSILDTKIVRGLDLETKVRTDPMEALKNNSSETAIEFSGSEE